MKNGAPALTNHRTHKVGRAITAAWHSNSPTAFLASVKNACLSDEGHWVWQRGDLSNGRAPGFQTGRTERSVWSAYNALGIAEGTPCAMLKCVNPEHCTPIPSATQPTPHERLTRGAVREGACLVLLVAASTAYMRRKQWADDTGFGGNGYSLKMSCLNSLCVEPEHIWQPASLTLLLEQGKDQEFLTEVRSRSSITDSGCWEWIGAKKRSGYSTFSIQKDGKSYTKGLHRYTYMAAHGPIEEHTPVHHKCANKPCVNPDHLQAVTPMENTAEMLERRYYQRRIKELEAQLRHCNYHSGNSPRQTTWRGSPI